jgi:hypothetical protein
VTFAWKDERHSVLPQTFEYEPSLLQVKRYTSELTCSVPILWRCTDVLLHVPRKIMGCLVMTDGYTAVHPDCGVGAVMDVLSVRLHVDGI